MLQIRQFLILESEHLPLLQLLSLFCPGRYRHCFATETVARNTSIGSGNAQNFAFADAGVDPTSATGIRTEFDFEQGQIHL